MGKEELGEEKARLGRKVIRKEKGGKGVKKFASRRRVKVVKKAEKKESPQRGR